MASDKGVVRVRKAWIGVGVIMIIAAFKGSGKSYFIQHTGDSKEFPFEPEGDVSDSEKTSSKVDADSGAETHKQTYLLRNYIQEIANHFHEYKYFVIPYQRKVLKGLQSRQIPYVLVYPERDAREEYLRRFRDRGEADPELIKAVSLQWNGWMDVLRRDIYGWCIELPKDKYLLDVKDEIDSIIQEKEIRIPYIFDSKREEEIKNALREMGLSAAEYARLALTWAYHHAGESKKMLEETGGISLANGVGIKFRRKDRVLGASADKSSDET